METRVVKFNIKTFIEDYVFYYESKNQEKVQEILSDFEIRYSRYDYKVRTSIQTFLFNNPISKQYADLQAIATRCEVKK